MREQSGLTALGLPTFLGLVLSQVFGNAGIGQTVNDNRGTTSNQAHHSQLNLTRAAINRGLPLLIKASAEEYPKHRDCFSCHNQAVPAVALSFAQQRGFTIDAQILRAIAEHTEADLHGAIDDYRKGQGQPGGVIRAGYALWALETTGWAADETTTTVVHYFSVALGQHDHWVTQSKRPPSESSNFTATALALRGLRAFTVPTPRLTNEDHNSNQTISQPVVTDTAVWRVRTLEWLKQAQPKETEDQVFRLWGLKYAGASASDLAMAAADLFKTQQPDGGWSQFIESADSNKTNDGKAPGLAGRPMALTLASDAYATGSTLVALHLAAEVATTHPAYYRGLQYLIRTQRVDGSWYVKSRSRPFQTYFESGFPHGPDQFISAAASSWAVAALALSCPTPDER
jgi:Squalene-hopene cyclase C-terminal domain